MYSQSFTLVKKMKSNGVEVENIVSDGAYSKSDNIKYANENDIKLVSNLSNCVSENDKLRKTDLEFTYNKDAKMYVLIKNWHLEKLNIKKRRFMVKMKHYMLLIILMLINVRIVH